MITLRRLCGEHPFRCAVVECTLGDFAAAGRKGDARWGDPLLAKLDPARWLDGWRPLPLLAFHSQRDAVTPFAAQASFLEALKAHTQRVGADPGLVTFKSWEATGAPQEHQGLGRYGGEARRLQVEFLRAHLDPA